MTPKRKRWWLLLEWAGTVVFGALPDVRPVNRVLARIFYFFFNQHKFPDLSTARRFNEKLINLKTSDEARSPLRARLTDKEFVKHYVADLFGPGHTAPTLAVIKSPRVIDNYEFPLPCVVKPTHSSQEVMHLTDRQPTNEERRRLKYWLWKNYFAASREPNYRHLEKKLIVEKVVGGAFGAVDDIKIMCFFGKPKLIHVDRGRYSEHRRDYYDMTGAHLPVELRFQSSGMAFPYPEKLAEMRRMCEKLSAGFRFIRVDFYVADGAVLVGELTSFPSNCVHPFQPESADLTIARALDEADFEITANLFGATAPDVDADDDAGDVVAFPAPPAACAEARERAETAA